MILPAKLNFQPTIIIDTREQEPLTFHRLPSMPGSLFTGDYSLAGAEHLFSIERKSIQDLVGCCASSNRERFERELHRLRGYRFKRLLIVGTRAEIEQHRYASNMRPACVLASLCAIEIRYDVAVVWSPTPDAAALQVESWVCWFARELLKATASLTLGAPQTDKPHDSTTLNCDALPSRPDGKVRRCQDSLHHVSDKLTGSRSYSPPEGPTGASSLL
jgi:DNA excision repair protein ERCC-4